MTANLINIKVRLFGPAIEMVGRDELEYALVSPATLRTLHELLCIKYPALAAVSVSLRWAINRTDADLNAELSEGDEVAIIPSVPGG